MGTSEDKGDEARLLTAFACLQGMIASTQQRRISDYTLVEARRQGKSSLNNRIVDYVVNRQNEDGGYGFCQGSLESSAQDTYYGLAIQSQLKTSFPSPEKTLKYIKETRLESIYSVYYVTKSLLELGEDPNPNLQKHVAWIIESKRYFGSTDFFSEVSSEFTTTFMALELANLLKINVNAREVIEWLLSFKNEDAGFGTKGQSDINSTYYAVASLFLLKANPENLVESLRFVRACEKSYGGFTVIPMNFTPYMEHTYYGTITLGLLDQENRYASQTIDWVLKCQNNNGGFARSDLGISTFVDTYFAIRVLQKLGYSLEETS